VSPLSVPAGVHMRRTDHIDGDDDEKRRKRRKRKQNRVGIHFMRLPGLIRKSSVNWDQCRELTKRFYSILLTVDTTDVNKI